MPNLDDNEESDAPKHNIQEELEKRLKDLWISEMRKYHFSMTQRPSTYVPGPRLDGGMDAHGRKFSPVWPKFAKFITDNKLNPEAFIKAQFANCKGQPPLSPTMLMGSAAVKRARAYRSGKEAEKTLCIARDGQVRQARNAVESYKTHYGPGVAAYRAVIADVNLPLSALFRYSLACECQQDDLAGVFYEPALIQYLDEPEAYDATWGPLVPESLRQAAKKIRGE